MRKGINVATNGTTIMIVEDYPDDVALIVRTLKKAIPGSEVVVAKDGAAALDYFFGDGACAGCDARVMPMVILLDLKLPKVDGMEVLRRLRGDERTKFLPVVVLTSSTLEQDLVESYRLGANSYVSKPVDSGQFCEAVRKLGLYWGVLNQCPPAPEGA